MKLSARSLLLIDRLFWLPHQITEFLFKTFASISSDHTEHLFTVKFMGLGSIIRFAALCEHHQVDKSKVTLVTFSQQKEVCTLFGFRKIYFLRTNNLFYFLRDCWNLLSCIRHQRPSCIINFERCSHAVSTFCLLLAWWGKFQTMSFEPNRSVFTKKIIIHPVDEITLEKLFLLGIERMAKTKVHTKTMRVKVHAHKILININASDFLLARRYPVESFAEIIRLLYLQHNKLEFYLTGSPHESQYVDTLMSLLNGFPVYNMAGAWNFQQLIEELSSCALFITGDSGPVHLATYLGIPAIALWGPTQPQHFGYERSRNLFSLSLNLACSPCFKHPASLPAHFCKGRIDCLKNLAPKTIANKASYLIETTSEQRTINFPEKWELSVKPEYVEQ